MNKVKEYWDIMASSIEDRVAVNHWVDSKGDPVDSSLYTEIASFVHGQAGDISKPKILEVGCGSGNILEALDKKYSGSCELFGCDFSQKMLDRSDFKTADYSCATADQLPYEDNVFDIILIHGVVQYFESLEYLDKVLQEFDRVLTRNGFVCIMDIPNSWYKDDMSNKKISIKIKRKTFGLISQIGVFKRFFSPVEKISGKKIHVPSIQGLYVDPSFFSNKQSCFSSVLLMLQDFRSKPVLYKKYRYNVVLRK